MTEKQIEEIQQAARTKMWAELLLAFPKAVRYKIADDLAHGWQITGITTQRPTFAQGDDGKYIRRVVETGEYAPLQPFLPFTAGPRTYTGEELPKAPEGAKT